MRYLKAIGLTALVALAASAIFASAASAQTKGFYAAGPLAAETTEFKDATLVGEQEGEPGEPWNFFKTPGGIVSCDNATFTGTIEGGTAEELTVTPHYEECAAAGQPATVNMNGCDYLFTQPTKLAEKEYTAKVGLTCPQENRVQIGVYLFGNSTSGTHSFKVCTIEVWPTGEVTGEGEEAHTFQEFGGESHAILKEESEMVEVPPEEVDGETVDETPADDITIAATVEGITYNDGCNSEEGEDGTYKNTVTATAFEDGEGEHTEVYDAWIEDEEA